MERVAFGLAVMLLCFAIMQKTLTMMVGVKYGDLPKMIKSYAKKR